MNLKPVNSINNDSNTIRVSDGNSPIRLIFKDVKGEVINLYDKIDYFYLTKDDDKFYSVTDISYEGDEVIIRLPKLRKGKYKAEIRDKDGSIYPANEDLYILLRRSFEDDKDIYYFGHREDILNSVEPMVIQHIDKNPNKFKGERGQQGFPGRDGLRGRDGKDGKDGVKGDKGDKGDPGIDVSSEEVIQARGEHSLLKDRLEENESQLADIVTVNVKTFGAKGDGISNDFPAFKSAIEYLGTIGGGTIFFPDSNSTYLLNPTGMFTSGTKPITLSSNIKYLRLTGDNSKIKLDDGLSFSSFIHAFNKELVFKIDNLYFDGNATNNPHNTGTTGNPRDNAHRLIEVYCKEVTIESTTFYDFHGVNIVVADRHPDLTSSDKSICQFINNKIEKFGYDSSNSIHDSSALYSHVDYNSTEDGHYILATGNIFEGDSNTSYSNAYCAMELGGKNVICTNNITTGFYIGVILAHQFVNDSVIVANNNFNKCVQGVTMWSYQNGGAILSTDTKGLKNIKISNNQINIGLEYWKNKAVYSSHNFVNGFVTHDYTGITTPGNLYRDIENIYITDNVINYDISNAPVSFSYSAIQLAEFTLADPNNNLTFKNVVIKDNKVFNSATKALNISGRNIEDVIIENNDFIGFCKNMTSGARAVTINNKTPDNIFKNLTMLNNKMIDKEKDVTYGLQLDVNNGENVLIENNKWDNNWVSGVIFIEKPINHLTINETVNKDFEGDIVKLKETLNIKGQYKTPERKLDDKKRITYYVDSPSQINVLCYVNDLIETVNLTPGGYMGYLCIKAGVPGEWKGMGLIEV